MRYDSSQWRCLRLRKPEAQPMPAQPSSPVVITAAVQAAGYTHLSVSDNNNNNNNNKYYYYDLQVFQPMARYLLGMF